MGLLRAPPLGLLAAVSRSAGSATARAVGAAVFVVSLLLGCGAADDDAAQPDCDSIWQREGASFYESNPTYVEQRDDSSDWQFSSPEAQGLDGPVLEEAVDRLFDNDSLLSVIVIRDGALVLERYGNGGGQFASNNIHSASKPMIHALAGIAVRDGHLDSLDTAVGEHLPAQVKDQPAATRAITVRQLLAMRSGLAWTEDSTEQRIEQTGDWVAAILALPIEDPPGERFNYSTGNTHVVSGVLQSATGTSTCAFAQRELFGPMGIMPEHWGRDPMGVFSGGYNVYLTPRELAKFGVLFAQSGSWDGKQLVPAETVTDAFTERSPKDPDGFGYSGGWWTREIAGHVTYLAWGWGGQYLYVIPSLDLVFSTTHNTHEAHDTVEVDADAFVEDVLVPAVQTGHG